MKNLVLLVLSVFLFTTPIFGQEVKKEKPKKNIFKEFYNDFLKYATIYGAGDYRAPYESSDKKY